MTNDRRWFSPPRYGMPNFSDLFTPRQLTAMTTFSDLVKEAREKVLADALVVQASCLHHKPRQAGSLRHKGRNQKHAACLHHKRLPGVVKRPLHLAHALLAATTRTLQRHLFPRPDHITVFTPPAEDPLRWAMRFPAGARRPWRPGFVESPSAATWCSYPRPARGPTASAISAGISPRPDGPARSLTAAHKSPVGSPRGNSIRIAGAGRQDSAGANPTRYAGRRTRLDRRSCLR